jgi:hypothetical protein
MRPSVLSPAQRRRGWIILAAGAAYLAVQVVLIVRGHFVPDKHFAFWMFPESTYFTARLSRLLADGSEVRTGRGGVWTVPADDGRLTYRWARFVDGYRLDALDTRQRAKGVFDENVEYFRHALDYVAERIPRDTSTRQLVLRIEYRRAGGPREALVLESAPRPGVAP